MTDRTTPRVDDAMTPKRVSDGFLEQLIREGEEFPGDHGLITSVALAGIACELLALRREAEAMRAVAVRRVEELERENERLRAWIAWIDIHCNRTGWYGVESALHRARNGEEVPS